MKPINYDISFQYVCEKCNGDHWLFLREVVQENKIFCECGHIIDIDIINDISVNYANQATLHKDVLKSCVDTLLAYGYSANEAKEMIIMSFNELKSNDHKKLIQYSITKFGEQYV